MFIQMKRLVVLLAMLTVVMSGCGPKAAPSTSVMDTPEYHYAQGLKYFDRDQLDDAMREFQRAIDLAPKVSLGYIGKGLVLGKKEDFKAASKTGLLTGAIENMANNFDTDSSACFLPTALVAR